MTVERNSSTVRDIFERVWNQGDFDGLDRVMAEETVFHYRRSSRITDLDDLKGLVADWRSGFPDLQFTMEEMIEGGSIVAARLTHAGTHLGRWRGHEPTGNRIEIDAMFFFRFEGDRIAEIWEVEDELAMWQQLGLSP